MKLDQQFLAQNSEKNDAGGRLLSITAEKSHNAIKKNLQGFYKSMMGK